jgi:Rrf2 family protein
MSSEYAVHGLLYLAINSDREITMLTDISEALNVPESTFRKVFQTLAKTGIVNAYRGAKGGYSLARSPQHITFKDIIEAIEGTSPIYHCLVERRRCELGENCAINSAFNRVQEQIYRALEEITLQEMVDSILSEKKQVKWLRLWSGKM